MLINSLLFRNVLLQKISKIWPYENIIHSFISEWRHNDVFISIVLWLKLIQFNYWMMTLILGDGNHCEGLMNISCRIYQHILLAHSERIYVFAFFVYAFYADLVQSVGKHDSIYCNIHSVIRWMEHSLYIYCPYRACSSFA